METSSFGGLLVVGLASLGVVGCRECNEAQSEMGSAVVVSQSGSGTGASQSSGEPLSPGNPPLALSAAVTPDLEEATRGDFEGFVKAFAASWDGSASETLKAVLSSTQSLWVIHSAGAHWRVTSAAAAPVYLFEDRFRDGFAHSRRFGFKCAPSEGSAPAPGNCIREEERESQCSFGDVTLSHLQEFSRLLRANGEREFPVQSSKFLSDNDWGAVFYFSRVLGHWRLRAIAALDCPTS